MSLYKVEPAGRDANQWMNAYKGAQKHTHVSRLFPVPIAMVIINGVMSVTTVHLPCVSSDLIELRPVVFRSFAMKMTTPRSVSSAVKVHALVLVVLDM